MTDSIFKSTETMPPKSNSPDVVRTAQTMGEMQKNYTPAAMPRGDGDVKNLERPRRGHGY
jgi:hypothetical protein